MLRAAFDPMIPTTKRQDLRLAAADIRRKFNFMGILIIQFLLFWESDEGLWNLCQMDGHQAEIPNKDLRRKNWGR
jgi:hypothetical protein